MSAKMLVAVGIDELEAPHGQDVALAFERLGLSEGRSIDFYAIQDNAGMGSGHVIRGEVHTGYLELDGVVAERMPRVLVVLHHGIVTWRCYEIQIFSDPCTGSPQFRSWADGVSAAHVTVGGYEACDYERHHPQFPRVGDRMFGEGEMDFLSIEAIPALDSLTERMKIGRAPLDSFDFPGGETYEKEVEALARVMAGIHDHHPWLRGSDC